MTPVKLDGDFNVTSRDSDLLLRNKLCTHIWIFVNVACFWSVNVVAIYIVCSVWSFSQISKVCIHVVYCYFHLWFKQKILQSVKLKICCIAILYSNIMIRFDFIMCIFGAEKRKRLWQKHKEGDYHKNLCVFFHFMQKKLLFYFIDFLYFNKNLSCMVLNHK